MYCCPSTHFHYFLVWLKRHNGINLKLSQVFKFFISVDAYNYMHAFIEIFTQSVDQLWVCPSPVL